MLVEGMELEFDKSALTRETKKIKKGVWRSEKENKGEDDPFIVSVSNVLLARDISQG